MGLMEYGFGGLIDSLLYSKALRSYPYWEFS